MENCIFFWLPDLDSARDWLPHYQIRDLVKSIFGHKVLVCIRKLSESLYGLVLYFWNRQKSSVSWNMVFCHAQTVRFYGSYRRSYSLVINFQNTVTEASSCQVLKSFLFSSNSWNVIRAMQTQAHIQQH